MTIVATSSPSLPYLCVSHTGCSDEGLLDRLALGEACLLLGWWRLLLLLPHVPLTLDKELHHLHVAPQGRVNQGALAVLIQVVHLLTERDSISRANTTTATPSFSSAYLCPPAAERRYDGHVPAGSGVAQRRQTAVGRRIDTGAKLE